MTSVLTPVLSEQAARAQAQLPGGELQENLALHKQDTKEYIADMLKELSAIAQWAELDRAHKYIEAALHELHAQEQD